MAGRIANVWAVECSKCHVGVDQPCLDLSSPRHMTRYLFDRRTHVERARKLRKEGPVPYTTGYTVGTSTTSGTLTIDPVWNSWVTATNSTTTTFSVQADVWRSWNATIATATGNMTAAFQRVADVVAPELTDDEIRVRRERRQQQEREERSRLERQREMERALRTKRDEAEARGWALLRSVVPAEDITETYMVVRGGVSGSPYRIYFHGIHGNVYLYDEHGCRLHSYCGAPQVHIGTAAERGEARRRGELTTIPNSDAWLGQYLALKYNEIDYLDRANRSVLARCHQAAVAA